jgi:hypothetical protein
VHYCIIEPTQYGSDKVPGAPCEATGRKQEATVPDVGPAGILGFIFLVS